MTSKSIRRNYYQLLREPEWIEFSQRLIDEHESCSVCGESENLQCHLTANADELWNEALRNLSAWEIYEITKAIRDRNFGQLARLIERDNYQKQLEEMK